MRPVVHYLAGGILVPAVAARHPYRVGQLLLHTRVVLAHNLCVDIKAGEIVAEQLGVKEEEVQTEASFVEDLGADSLDTVELVMALEEEFETEIPDEEAEKITTVQQAIDYGNDNG